MHDAWLVFTDGACNPDLQEGSIGGILFDPTGRCVKFFGETVPKHIMDDLFQRFQNPIHELEVLPCRDRVVGKPLCPCSGRILH